MQAPMKVLLAGGDPLLAELIGKALKDLRVGDSFVQAATLADALSDLRRSSGGKPCLVLLDLDSAAEDSLELLRQLKSDVRLRLTPVVVLRGVDRQDDVDRCFELGAVGCIAKPTDYETLRGQLRTLICHWGMSEVPHLD